VTFFLFSNSLCCMFYLKIEKEFGTTATQSQDNTRKHIDWLKTPHNQPTYDLDDESVTPNMKSKTST
jgi:hypothetical protein